MCSMFWVSPFKGLRPLPWLIATAYNIAVGWPCLLSASSSLGLGTHQAVVDEPRPGLGSDEQPFSIHSRSHSDTVHHCAETSDDLTR